MLRTFLCATLALLLAAGIGLAADKNAKKKKGTTVAGTVKAIDAAAGKLTVTVKVKKATEDKDFTVGDAVKVVTFSGDTKSELTGKDGLKNVKVGDKIRVHSDEGGKVVSIQVGNPPKKKKKNK
jgi:hypothetical protein